MGLETATYISDLDPLNPASGDLISKGDDHIRLIKEVLKATFPNLTGAVGVTEQELNTLTGVGDFVQAQLDAKAALSHTHLETDIEDGNVFPRLNATETIPGSWSFSQETYFNSGIRTFSTAGQAYAVRFQATPGTQPVRALYQNANFSTDQKNWVEAFFDGEWQLHMMNDGGSVSKTVLRANRTGNVVTSLMYGNATDNPTHNFYGSPTVYLNGTTPLSLQSDTPGLAFYESDAPTDEKSWRFYASGGDLSLRAYNDSFSSYNPALIVERSGATVTATKLYGTVTVNGTAVSLSGHTHDDRYYTESEVTSLLAGKANTSHTHDDRYYTEAEVDAKIAAAGITSGSFTMSLREGSPTGTVLTTGTAYWQKVGKVVQLRVPQLYASSSSQFMYLTGLPAAIVVGSLATLVLQKDSIPGLNAGSSDWLTVQIVEGATYLDLRVGAAPANFSASTGNKGTNGENTITYFVSD